MKAPRKIPLWSVLFWLLVWQAGSMALNQKILLVSPLQVLFQLGGLMQTSAFWSAIGFSLLRIAAGFFLAAGSAVILAVLAVRFRLIQELLVPPVLAMKTVPVASFIILALIWFSSKNLAVFISFLMVFPILYTNVQTGIQAADEQLLEMASVFRLPTASVIRYVYIPQVMPFFRSGCSVALGLSWKAGIAAEVIGMPSGSVGQQLQQAKIYLDTPNLLAWTLVIILASLAFEKLFMALLSMVEKRLQSVKL